MKVTIRLRYHTRFGQTLFICGDHPWLGGGQPKNAVPLRYVNEELWEAALDLPDSPASTASAGYYFILRNPDGSVLEEFRRGQKTGSGLSDPRSHCHHGFLERHGRGRKRLLHRTVQGCLLRTEMGAPLPARRPTQPTLSMSSRRCCPKVRRSASWQRPCFGQLEPSRTGIAPTHSEDGRFNMQLNLAEVPFPVAYKYGIYDLQKNAFVRYEDGADRSLAEAAPPDGQMIVNDGFVRCQCHRGAERASPSPSSACAANGVLASANFWICPRLRIGRGTPDSS